MQILFFFQMTFPDIMHRKPFQSMNMARNLVQPDMDTPL